MKKEEKGKFESVYSYKMRAGKRRTYFFDVRKTKGEDFFITLTESTKRFNGRGFNRHKIYLYKEDFNRFLSGLEDVIDHVKSELMPDFDYEQFERRQEKWEASQEIEEDSESGSNNDSIETKSDSEEEDMAW